MPCFDAKTVEQWRRERVHETTVPNNLTCNQPVMMRATIDEDIDEEQHRLVAALKQVQESRAALGALKRKSIALRSRYGV